MKHFIPHYGHVSREVLHSLEKIQDTNCKEEMKIEMDSLIPTLAFNSHSERLLAEDIFKTAWLLARYLERG
jgi:hypothetical protein